MRVPSFAQPPVSSLIETGSEAAKLTLLVGAGASMETGLPSWGELLNRLLIRGARERDLVDVEDQAAKERWLDEALRDGVLGAAALVDVLAGGERDQWVLEELYRPTGRPDAFFPGPIARQIPTLAQVFGEHLRLMTINYDDLIGQALRDADFEPAALATEDHHCAEAEFPILHLHGYLGRDRRERGQLVLSEADYQQMQAGMSWQETAVRSAPADSSQRPPWARPSPAAAGEGLSRFCLRGRELSWTYSTPRCRPRRWSSRSIRARPSTESG